MRRHKLSLVPLALPSRLFRRFTTHTYASHLERMKQFKTLYRPEHEKDSCGVGLLANMKRIPSRSVIVQATQMLERMAHRGGCGAEPNTGDGAGMLLAMPHSFFKAIAEKELNFKLPELNEYAVGMVFFSADGGQSEACKRIFEDTAKEFKMEVLGWRSVPTNNSNLGRGAKLSEPTIEQVFISNTQKLDTKTLELALLRMRNIASAKIEAANLKDFYVCSLSSKTITYKGQLTSEQLAEYYLDLADPAFTSYSAMVHSRFSTNTFPSWDRAQPNRMLCHNGEINTLRGNKNWMQARGKKMISPLLSPNDQTGLLPVCSDSKTDSGNFDSVLELLTRSSHRDCAESMMMLIPEAWQNNTLMSENKRGFYEFNSCIMEPWDGPAMMAFSDGDQLGAVLDRNGLRPSRFYVTKDDHVILSSEIGVLPDLDHKDIKFKGRLEPGKMFLVDFNKGGLVHDEELKEKIASKLDYKSYISKNLIRLDNFTSKSKSTTVPTAAEKNTQKESPESVKLLRQSLNTFGHTVESLEMILSPMVSTSSDPLGSMGIDTPLAVLSHFPKQLSEYFKQLFAQVTNPPIDPIREEIVMSLRCPVGPEQNLLDLSEAHCKRIEISQPVLSEEQFNLLDKDIKKLDKDLNSVKVFIDFEKDLGGKGLEKSLDDMCKTVEKAIVENKANVIVLSHKNVCKEENKAMMPSLMAVGCLHHFLIQKSLRTDVAIILEAGDAKEVHDFCTLLGFGCDAVYPFLSFAAIKHLNAFNKLGGVTISDIEATERYRKAIGKGMLKVMAKMGISTLQSYKGAQIFEAVGLSSEIVDKCFRGTTSRIEGASFESVAADMKYLRDFALGQAGDNRDGLVRNVGDYHFRHGGEVHQNDPAAMAEMQYAVRNYDLNAWKRYTDYTMNANKEASLRGLLSFIPSSHGSIPLEEVEPVNEILRRFVTGAMSLGSISAEAHESLAIAMNKIGGRSNTGEGGEDPIRFKPLPNGESKRSAIKQVASGRFGVTAEYLANADQIQIKMAQGAKPGEGGELPGYKVSVEIAKVRGTTPSVGLISPPPHHDIYSIEDLAQLIYDLKNAASPEATVSVKLVSEVGVGIVAAGVAKAKADHIVVSGGDGGTGAAAWTGIHRAGLPWELGVAETQQTLLVNNLRSRVRLQTDGQIKTGRDVVIAALLGAEEMAFSTAPLVALGCIMMRKCHLNTCPVGIATQDPTLRKKFQGLPEHVVNFFLFLSEDVRNIMAKLGVRRFVDLVGNTGLLEVDEVRLKSHPKARTLDLTPLLTNGKDLNPDAVCYNATFQDHQLEAVLDHTLINKSKAAIESKIPVYMEHRVTNANRTLGTMLSNRIAKTYGLEGLPDNTINIKLTGSAGQSLGFVLAKGITIELEGDANDSVGKGLCGGKIVISPPKSNLSDKEFLSEENVIIGNVALYGATSGEAFFRGKAGERFCVRNSGAKTVVEGVGDHGCEYMTGGRAVILGSTGRNFAAGMSGGIAYVYDPKNTFASNCNTGMVSLSKLTQNSQDSPNIEQDEFCEELRELVEKHVRYTGSSVGKRILINWEESLDKFVKVLPNDYKKVLEQRKKEKEAESEKVSVSAVAH